MAGQPEGRDPATQVTEFNAADVRRS